MARTNEEKTQRIRDPREIRRIINSSGRYMADEDHLINSLVDGKVSKRESGACYAHIVGSPGAGVIIRYGTDNMDETEVQLGLKRYCDDKNIEVIEFMLPGRSSFDLGNGEGVSELVERLDGREG